MRSPKVWRGEGEFGASPVIHARLRAAPGDGRSDSAKGSARVSTLRPIRPPCTPDGSLAIAVLPVCAIYTTSRLERGGFGNIEAKPGMGPNLDNGMKMQ